MLHPATQALRLSSITRIRPHPQILTCRYSDLNTAFPLPFSPQSASRGLQTRTVTKRKGTNQPVVNLVPENRCAQVRTWELLRNTSEALTLIRAVEQKYGPIESFEFRKDIDSPTIYQTVIRITFRSVESFNRIPEDFEIFHVRPPKVGTTRPGGIGLNEISSLFTNDVEFLTADQVSESGPEDRTVNFRIERARQPFVKESPYKYFGTSMTYRQAVASMMLKWGGFHEMQPIDSTRRITNADLTNETLDHVFMRRTLRQSAAFLNERNPYEIYPTNSEESQENTQENIRMSRRERKAWFSDAVPPRVTRDPFQQVLEMRDSQLTAPRPHAKENSEPEKPPASPQHTTSNGDSSHESAIAATTSPTTPSTPFVNHSPTLPSERQPSAPSNLPPQIESSASSSSTINNPTIPLPFTFTTDSDMSQPCTPTSPGPEKPNLSPIEFVVLPPKEARKQGKTPIEFLTHEQKPLGPNPRRHRHRHLQVAAEGKAKLAEEVAEEPKNSKPEHSSRLGGLYDRIMGIINNS